MLDIITPEALYAAESANTTITDFLNTGVGGVIQLFLGAAGFLVLLFGVFAAIKNILGGKVGGALKSILGAGIIAAFLIFPAATLGGLIDAVQNLLTSLTGSVGDIDTEQGTWGGA